MAPGNDQEQERAGGSGEADNQVPQVMLDQANAAVAGENDMSSYTAAERRHMGHDVAVNVPEYENTQADYDIPPPAYGDQYGTVNQEQEGFGTKATVANDGRVNIRIDQRNRRLSQLLVPNLKQLQAAADQQHAPPPPYIPPSLGGAGDEAPPPPMNVVIQIVGSRGDVQPFVALGKVLKETYGHRVRVATHPNFKDFVTENDLEFFSIGGDPSALMSFMVKNPGLMPGFDTLRAGDVGKRRKEVAEYLRGCWRSCFETGDGMGPEATDDTIEDWTSHNPNGTDYLNKPFVADCIIANPPSFAHVHCAEKLGIPLHIMFTMPYSPTQAFPHPLANIQSSNADDHLTNYISYALVDMLTWQGLGDIINRFRQRSLGLDAVSLMWAPGMLQRLQIPHTYCWSPALIPKPKDWGANISISGFYFLDLAKNYTPDPELKAFLDAGPPPVYIGFGSIVLDDPNAMTKLLFDAVKLTGQRALVSKGWGGMGADELGKPDNVFMLGNCPHDWLFKQVSCVVHHGGAGTTAAGITAGRPTLVVPFFGDQPFWGAMVARAGAGPEPIHHRQLTADNLADAIKKCLEPETQERARELAAKIATEKGSDIGAQSFHQFLDVDKLRCSLAPSRPAVWRIKRTQAQLSAMAACTLAQEGLLDFNDLKLYRPREYEADEGPWDPITGGASALVGTMSTMMLGVADFPIATLKALKIHPDAQTKKEGKKPEGQQGTDSSSASVKSGGTGTTARESEDTAPTTTGSSSPTPAMTPRSNADNSTMSEQASRSTSSFNFEESLQRLNAGPLSPGSQRDLNGKRMNSSLADALSGQLGNRPRSRSGSRSQTPGQAGSGGTNWKSNFQNAQYTAKGVHRIVGAGIKSPLDFTMGLTRGFHNAPKLYGDDTVRKSENVTDLKSGLRAAAKEFGFGMYDGITGLVTQPMKGAAKEGPAGFVKGIGKGIGGIALKPGAAFFGIPGYTMKGVYKELQKHFGSSVQNYIIASRTAQGFDEYQKASPEECRDVIMRWQVLQSNLKKKRNPDEMVRDILKEQMDKKEAWLQGRREKRSGSGSRARSRAGTTTSSRTAVDPENAMLAMGTPTNTMDPAEAEQRAVDEAIRLSVLQTSHGDAAEDARVEQGIRDNMAEIQRVRTTRIDQHEEDQLQQAMNASSAEAARYQTEREQYEQDLEKALAQSLKEQRGWNDSDSEAGIHSPALSEATLPPPPNEKPPGYIPTDTGHLAGTTQAGFERQQSSSKSAGGSSEKTQQERDEERIVMDYVKKQSLLEEQSKKKMGGKSGDEEDEELQKALKLSMQEHGEASGSAFER
ncbi:Sterol 3-beta-glucosyltransferase UGT80B1 [Pseudocercospora fuligena]|uniref:Sterol 3-beta-glucosyltransferase UGT80B1 n=1 Tax=Pseudocercospora fuligena TaxID=685502 RepID=A0A8H6VMH2_9PEZI|nr:Sterol 3-beta-glucosyltransferase UGT80B1 [Pseudocercospora fuligena]